MPTGDIERPQVARGIDPETDIRLGLSMVEMVVVVQAVGVMEEVVVVVAGAEVFYLPFI